VGVVRAALRVLWGSLGWRLRALVRGGERVELFCFYSGEWMGIRWGGVSLEANRVEPLVHGTR